MINKEIFLKIIELQKRADTFETKLSELGIDTFNTPVYDAYGWYLDMLFAAYFTVEGKDYINWWLFERGPESEVFDGDDNILKADTVDELWESVTKYRI